MQIRVFTYSKSVMNKVVRHKVDAEPITDWLYIQKEKEDSSGNAKAIAYLYYPSINNGILIEQFTLWAGDTTRLAAIEAGVAHVSTPNGYLVYLDACIANGKWVGNAEIALAMEIDAQKAETYKVYRQEYLDRQNVKYAERNKKWKEERTEKERIAKEEKENAINAFVDTIKNGGKVINVNSILVDVCNRFYVDLPIKLKGWIYKSLYSITFKDGKAIGCERRGNMSTTIFTYLNQLCDRVAEEAEEESASEEYLEQLQHLFGLDKNNA